MSWGMLLVKHSEFLEHQGFLGSECTNQTLIDSKRYLRQSDLVVTLCTLFLIDCNWLPAFSCFELQFHVVLE